MNIFIITVLSLLIFIFLIRHLFLSRQIKRIANQLNSMRKQQSRHKIGISLGNRQIEELAKEINMLISRLNEIEADKKRSELQLKQAISGMSHDLRTPLTAIIGYLQLLKEEETDEENKSEYLSVSYKKALSLHELINNFFLLSSAESGELPFHPEKIHVNNLLKEIILSYYDQFQAINKEPVINISSEDLIVRTDKNAFIRVAENLILNAIQHADGEIHMTADKAGNLFRFTVENECREGKKPDIKKLFDRFYTADETRRSGHGLGLAIVKSLLDKMDGQVIAEIDGNKLRIICEWKLCPE